MIFLNMHKLCTSLIRHQFFQILHHSPQIPFHHLIHQHIRLIFVQKFRLKYLPVVKIGICKVFRQSGQQGGSEGVAVNRDAARVGRLDC